MTDWLPALLFFCAAFILGINGRIFFGFMFFVMAIYFTNPKERPSNEHSFHTMVERLERIRQD